MKKRIAAVLAALAIFSAAGCNNGGSAAAGTTAAQTDEEGRVTAVAFEAEEAPDTTEEALAYLAGVAPRFRKFLDTRRSIPLTFESTTEADGKKWITNLYIKDEHNAVQYALSPEGTETRVIYTGDKAYQISPEDKEIYMQEGTEEEIADIIATFRVPLSVDNVMNAQYSSGTDTVDGVEYYFETIASGDAETTYFYDMQTDKVVYTKSGDNITKIDVLENTFDKESMFELPADYNTITYADLVERYEQSLAASS